VATIAVQSFDVQIACSCSIPDSAFYFSIVNPWTYNLVSYLKYQNAKPLLKPLNLQITRELLVRTANFSLCAMNKIVKVNTVPMNLLMNGSAIECFCLKLHLPHALL
jgi:hypothetical protein